MKKISPVFSSMMSGVPIKEKEYKPPTPMQRIKASAQDAKHRATRKWMDGEISSAEHNKLHGRANHVMKHAHKYK